MFSRLWQVRTRGDLAGMGGLLAALALLVGGCQEDRAEPQPWRFQLDAAVSADVGSGPVAHPQCSEPAPETCSALSHRIWPVAADTRVCTDSDGDRHDATGRGAANWFDFGGCGRVKEFEVDSCSWVRVDSHGDSCSSCQLWHIDYVVEERRNGNWEKVAEFDPPDERGMEHETCLQIRADRFRIRARDGFYVKLFTR